jgi:hypothetical protein
MMENKSAEMEKKTLDFAIRKLFCRQSRSTHDLWSVVRKLATKLGVKIIL